MPALKLTVRLPNGENLDLFYIGKLATALGRTPNTIRRWEIAGILPDPCFRDPKGARLYSQEQIDVIVQAAEKCKIRQGSTLSRTSFSARCYKGLAELKEKYKKGK